MHCSTSSKETHYSSRKVTFQETHPIEGRESERDNKSLFGFMLAQAQEN